MAKIMNVEKEFFAHDGIVYTIVYYESGRISEYIEGKEPKTVKAWMEKNWIEPYKMSDIEKEIYTEKEIERNPFGVVACMESIKWHIETLKEDPNEMLKEYRERAEKDVFFNKTMIDAVRQYIEEHELTQEQESEGEEMTEEQKREAKKEAREAIDKAIEAYKGTDRPSEAVNMLVETVGYDEAKKIIATLVNAVSLHDGRIYERTRTWANSVTEAPTNGQLRDMGIYGVDSWIHSAHVDQLGEAMRKYEPPQEEQTEQEPTETTAEPKGARGCVNCSSFRTCLEFGTLTADRKPCKGYEYDNPTPKAPADEPQTLGEVLERLGENVTVSVYPSSDATNPIARYDGRNSINPTFNGCGVASVTESGSLAEIVLEEGSAYDVTDIMAEIRRNCDYVEYITDFGGTAYLDDALSEIADNRTSIYYSDIYEFIRNNIELVEDAIEEFGWDGVGKSLHGAGQMAEFGKIRNDLYSHLEDVVAMYGFDYYQDNYGDGITAEIRDKLSEEFEAKTYDINYLSDIEDIVNEIMEEGGEDDEKDVA